MTTLYEEDMDISNAAEVHWSTSTILTMFFAASLISALVVGLGFSYKRNGTQKLISGGPLAETAKPDRSAPVSAASRPMRSVRRPSPGTLLLDAKENSPSSTTPATDSVRRSMIPPPPASAHLVQRADATASRSGAKTKDSRYMVQVGAIGNRKDAQRLVAQLRRQGFHAAIYPGARDKYLHVQLGPFATTQQAQTVRHRVLAHGYHAMLKPAS
ncbi:MAG TPA: SPOR domain-containing protein [Acidobacteriaceae bacterium]|nr:SPOR domain-containing protein [Acidobacteriaceae bacterium]